MASEENTHIAMSLVRSLDVITIPMARASILWLIGQYSTNPEMMKIAPDIFRQNVKMFSSCDEIVKLQVLNLGAKILSVYQSLLYPSSSTTSSSITSASSFKPKEANILSRCMKLFAYCLEIARFDSSYDVRDRARILKSLVYDRIAVSTGVDAPFTPSQQSLSINLLDVMLKRTAAPFADSPFASKGVTLVSNSDSPFYSKHTLIRSKQVRYWFSLSYFEYECHWL